ncbi:hypothetical protein HPB48_016458 [Haemaphysalis longicornis]|uniref:Uncharacterized protein n=1 Tax=Haemaphysalis longicornis TaxID=44386 RepID=A0A9J6FP42_HAELO|nr:hypothetical protein HPB48_016458 [Haemaphysalis longicornis]
MLEGEGRSEVVGRPRFGGVGRFPLVHGTGTTASSHVRPRRGVRASHRHFCANDDEDDARDDRAKIAPAFLLFRPAGDRDMGEALSPPAHPPTAGFPNRCDCFVFAAPLFFSEAFCRWMMANEECDRCTLWRIVERVSTHILQHLCGREREHEVPTSKDVSHLTEAPDKPDDRIGGSDDDRALDKRTPVSSSPQRSQLGLSRQAAGHTAAQCKRKQNGPRFADRISRSASLFHPPSSLSRFVPLEGREGGRPPPNDTSTLEQREREREPISRREKSQLHRCNGSLSLFRWGKNVIKYTNDRSGDLPRETRKGEAFSDLGGISEEEEGEEDSDNDPLCKPPSWGPQRPRREDGAGRRTPPEYAIRCRRPETTPQILRQQAVDLSGPGRGPLGWPAVRSPRSPRRPMVERARAPRSASLCSVPPLCLRISDSSLF